MADSKQVGADTERIADIGGHFVLGGKFSRSLFTTRSAANGRAKNMAKSHC